MHKSVSKKSNSLEKLEKNNVGILLWWMTPPPFPRGGGVPCAYVLMCYYCVLCVLSEWSVNIVVLPILATQTL